MKMYLDTTIEHECPYCHHENSIHVRITDLKRHGFQITVCHKEDGGCDKVYAVDYHLAMMHSTFKEKTNDA